MEEKNTKLDTIDKLLLAFLIVFAFINVILLLTTDVSAASDYHNVITNAIYTGTSHCTTNQTGICVSDTSSTSYSRYTFGTTSYQNTLSMNFWLNTSVRSNVNATIRLTGSNWANVSYTCQTNYFTDCRVVRANSTILNINFSNTGNGVSGVEFFITANGSILNTNSTFYVQKADLYETLITDNDQSTQDIINNQNDNTQEIISNANQNTQDLISQVQNLLEHDTELANKIIENTKCLDDYSYQPDIFMFESGYLDSSGVVHVDNNYMVSPYLQLLPNRSYSIIFGPARSGKYVCVYQGNKQLSQCYEMTGTINFTMGSTSNMLLRVVAVKSNGQFVPVRIRGPICNDWEQMANQKLQGTIDDDSIDQSQANSFFNDFNTNDNGGISSIVSKPLVLINSLLNNNNSCSALNITIPSFSEGMQDTQVSLPSGCELWDQAPNSLVVAWNTLVVGSACYVILKKLFKLIEQLKEPDNDSVEVIDL